MIINFIVEFIQKSNESIYESGSASHWRENSKFHYSPPKEAISGFKIASIGFVRKIYIKSFCRVILFHWLNYRKRRCNHYHMAAVQTLELLTFLISHVFFILIPKDESILKLKTAYRYYLTFFMANFPISHWILNICCTSSFIAFFFLFSHFKPN